jgi:O-antigen/teichoic acid export membrane protein
MQTDRRVLTNTIALTFSTGIGRLSTFAITLYIARALGAESLGRFSVVMSLLLVFQTISYLGQQQIIIREVARMPDRVHEYMVNGSVLVAIGGLLGMLLMITTANLINYESDVLTLVYAGSLSLIPGALAIVGEAAIEGRERMQYIALAWTISAVIKLSLALILLVLGAALWSVFLVLALANSALYLTYVWVIRNLWGHLRFSIDPVLVRHLKSLAGPFMVISIFGVIFKQVDVLILGKLTDSTTVGVYSAGFRLVQIGMLFLPAFMLALFPRMAEAFVYSPERLRVMAEQALKLLLTFILPVAVITTMLAAQLVFAFYGPGYQESVLVLQILAWMLVLFFANAVLFRIMLASDNERVTMRVAGVNMVSSVALNLLLIPRWGAHGVAVASFLTTLIALLQNYIFTARHLFKLDWLYIIAKPVLAAMVLGALLLVLQDAPIALSLSIGIPAYCAAVIALKIFSPEELDVVRRTWADAKNRISS